MKIAAIVLAAGKGTRFADSKVNKTAFKINGRSMLQGGLDVIEGLFDEIYVVVGYRKNTVTDSIKTKGIRYVVQRKRLGTGHAVKLAIKEIDKSGDEPDHILVANGDHLFQVKRKVIEDLIRQHVAEDNDATILTSTHPDPVDRDNGRIVRKGSRVTEIIERKDFTPAIRRMKELNSGNYIFKYSAIRDVLQKKKITPGVEWNIVYSIFELGKVGAQMVDFLDVGDGVNTKKELEKYLSAK